LGKKGIFVGVPKALLNIRCIRSCRVFPEKWGTKGEGVDEKVGEEGEEMVE
jgi:hypothetical protein